MTLSAELIDFDGIVLIVLRLRTLDHISRRLDRGLPVHEDEIEAALYTCAVALD
jgi:hypothetical protein